MRYAIIQDDIKMRFKTTYSESNKDAKYFTIYDRYVFSSILWFCVLF